MVRAVANYCIGIGAMVLKQEPSVPRRWCWKMLILHKPHVLFVTAAETAAGDGAAAACPEHGPQRTSLAQGAALLPHTNITPVHCQCSLWSCWDLWEQPGLFEDSLGSSHCSRVRMCLMDNFQWHEWDWKISAGNLIQRELKCGAGCWT